MARTVRDINLQSRQARHRLKARGKPYYRTIDGGSLHIGYRKPQSGAGKWVMRRYLGGQSYVVQVIGIADDVSDCNDASILSFEQAQRKARELRDDADRTAAGKGPYTVADACRDYLDFIGERRKSAADIETRIEAFVIPKLGAIEASKLTADAINKWLAGLAKTPPRVRTKKGAEQQHRQLDDSQEARRRRQATANRIWTSLRAALNRAFKARRIGSDTEWRRVEAFRDVDAARERLLTVAECKRLANASAPDFRRLLRAGLATGARYSELADLLVSDFNGEAVHIRKSKNGKERWIHLNPEGVALFKSLAAGKAPNALLLTRDDGERWAKNYQQVPMAAACKNGNVTPCGFHQLRHCYASWAVMGGMPLVALAKNLGHANTKMVEKHYGHLAKDYLTEITKATAPTFGFKSSRVRAIR